MSNLFVRIKPSVLANLDQSKQRKEFWFDGQGYHVQGIDERACPKVVAEAWTAHDSDLEIVYPNER